MKYADGNTKIGTMNAYENWMKEKKGKGSFYIAQYPVRWTAQSASHVLPVHSDTVLGFSGKHSSQAAITRQD